MEVGFLQAFHRVNDLDSHVVRLQGIGAELAGLPDEIISSSFVQFFAESDFVGDFLTVLGVLGLDAEGHFHGDVLVDLLRDEPEGQGTVFVVEVLVSGGCIPGIAEFVVLTGSVGDGTIDSGLGGPGLVLEFLREIRGGFVDIPLEVAAGESSATRRFEALDHDLGDDGLGGVVVQVSGAELHAGEGVIHHHGSTLGKVSVMLLLADGSLGKKDVLLGGARQRRTVVERNLLVRSVSNADTGGGGGHVEIEVDHFGLAGRPRAAIVVVMIAPAIAAVRIGVHGIIRKHEGIVAEAIGIDAHGRVQRAQVDGVGGSAPGGQGRVQFLDGLFQEVGISISCSSSFDADARLNCSLRNRFHRPGTGIVDGESDCVLTQRSQFVEILLLLAGGQHRGCDDCHGNVNLFHNSLSFKG